MSKAGSKISPLAVALLTFLSFGIVGYVWLILTMEELRRYRGKGFSGWLGLFLLPMLIAALFTIFSHSNIYVFSILIIVFLCLLFLLPFITVKNVNSELKKLGIYSRGWILNLIVQILTTNLLLVGFYLASEPRFKNDTNSIGVLLLIISYLCYCVWMFFAQNSINRLWDVAKGIKAFAVPVMKETDVYSTANKIKDM